MTRPRALARWRRALTWRATGFAGVVLALPALAALMWIASPLPPEVSHPGPVPSVELLDRHGIPLRSGRSPDGSRGGWVDLADIDPDLIRAVLAMEDERFYRHRGVDLRATARAFRDNLRASRTVSGASTITMQTARLVRNIPRTWPGKIRQALWALRLEAHLDKGSILEIYLNRLPLGQGAIGVAAAASLYFEASASELSLGQAALLAALAHAPSRDNPLVDAARAERRRAMVLTRLLDLGYAAPSDVERALAEPPIERGRQSPFLAPHFTTRALLWTEAAGDAPSGRLRTTLDLSVQRGIEAEVGHTVDMLVDRRVEHAAAVVLDNQTGSILAWVGSPDFWADTAGQVDMVVSRRQPGSALKPFLYGLAFDRGYSPASILPDIPKTYATAAGLYEPRNYDRRFRGPVRAREALASSFNVPAVELAHRLGPGSFLAALRRAGFLSLGAGAEHYGVGLALGNGDVTLLELANGYRALVNGGLWQPYRWLLEDDGAYPSLPLAAPPAAAETPDSGRRVVSETAANLVLDILADPVARTPGFGPETPFDFPFPVAVKTGTSRRFTDNWAVGVTRGFTVAVWVGNFSGRPMAGVSGISGAGPLLHRAVLLTARHYAPGTLPAPADVGLVPVRVCRLSGERAGSDCPEMIEWFRPGTEPADECDWHRDGRTVLPVEYAEWLDVHHEHDSGVHMTAGDPESSRDAAPRLRIISPLAGDRYEVQPGSDPRYASIALRAVGPTAKGLRWFVDGLEVTSPRWRLVPGSHTIRAETGSGDWDEVGIVVH